MANAQANRSRTLALWLSIVVPVVTAVLIFYLGTRHGPADFSLYVAPMNGEVQAGGVIQAKVTVEGSHGYKHPVSLAADDQPAGLAVAFAPPFGEAKPTYVSTATLSVGDGVPMGAHTISVQGLGADGKAHSVKYTLNVMPPSADKQQSPISVTLPEIKLLTPTSGETVPITSTVSGSAAGELPKGRQAWVVINPHPSPGQWWPQGGHITIGSGGPWDVEAWLGREKEDVGKRFDIAVVVVDETDDAGFRQYIEHGKETGEYPGKPLPPSAQIVDGITVTRR